ncbi:MAG TPA: hypothetical protein PK263_05370 [bacterium]|nr:hypothetical protein [bacterium]
MRFYQASMSSRVLKRHWELFKDPINVLLSYAYAGPDFLEILIKCRSMIVSVILDSGAWSVAQGVASLSLAGLISYLKMNGHHFDRYFNFDTDFSNNGFLNNIVNQITMERAGLQPVPVVHNVFDREIDYYVQSGKHDWIALGSSQTTNFDDLAYAVCRIKKGNPDIRIHWFGGSKFEWLCKLPIASCDTTGWASTGKFGFIRYWNPNDPDLDKGHSIYTSGMIRDVDGGKYEYVTYPWRNDLDKYLQETFGLTFRDLCGYDGAYNMQLVNTRFFVEQEQRINAERIRQGIPLE